MLEEARVNPQMAATAKVAPAVASDVKRCLPQDEVFQIALVIQDYAMATDRALTRAINAIANPLCLCKVTSLVVLSSIDETDTKYTQARQWLTLMQVQTPQEVNVLHGDTGFQEILQSKVLDAVYVIVPTESQRNYGIAVLQAGKHVLLKDPVSTSFDSFRDQLESARRVGKFIQFSTMFVHHHRVKQFMECVLRANFGSIESIDATLIVNYKDVEKVGVGLPLQVGDGCIRRLGRYCVLISVLLLSRAGSVCVSAKVTRHEECSPSGEPVQADCVVRFSDGRVSTFRVAYSDVAPTRQVIQVQAHDRHATMTDFVIPHPDGLATYRIYKKAMNPMTGELDVEHGEAVDVPSGLTQDVMMWRSFRELSRSVDRDGWDAKEGQVLELTKIALQTKRIMNALVESIDRGYEEIPIEMEDCEV
jgi:predicted dehydrogenase